MRKVIITINQRKGKPGCEGCKHHGLGRWCEAFQRNRKLDKFGKHCRLRACTAGEQKLTLLERQSKARSESANRLKLTLNRLVNAIDTYEAASSVIILKKGDLGYDEYEEALDAARKAVTR